MALLTVTEFLDRYDQRAVAQRLLDDGQDAPDWELIDATSVAGRRLLAAIADSEGLLVAAAAVGKRYDADELQAVVDAGDNSSARIIKRIVADLAFGLILKRRSLPSGEFQALAPGYAEATALLELVRRGDRVFPDIPGVAVAGLPDVVSSIPRPGDQPQLWSSNVRLFGVLDHDC